MSTSYYKFIEVDQVSRIKTLDYKRHDKLNTCYELYLKLSTVTPVHVGSGNFRINRSGLPVSINIRDNEGNLIIPGSSFKGVMAHYHLAVFGQQRMTSILFGFPSYMSRVLVDDVKPLSHIKPKEISVDESWAPKKKQPGKIKIYINKIQYARVKDVLILECIPENTDMYTKATVLNSNETELAQLLLALGVTPTDSKVFLVGFGKPKGIGKMKIKDFSVKRISSDLRIEDVNKNIIYSEIKKLFTKYKDRFNRVYG